MSFMSFMSFKYLCYGCPYVKFKFLYYYFPDCVKPTMRYKLLIVSVHVEVKLQLIRL